MGEGSLRGGGGEGRLGKGEGGFRRSGSTGTISHMGR